MNTENRPEFILVTGSNASGKTTLIEKNRESLEFNGLVTLKLSIPVIQQQLHRICDSGRDTECFGGIIPEEQKYYLMSSTKPSRRAQIEGANFQKDRTRNAGIKQETGNSVSEQFMAKTR